MAEYELTYLCNAIKKGNVILLLGSGASDGSLNRKGESILSTKELSEALAKESGFEYANESLGEVYAASKQVLGSNLDRFLEHQFRYCKPSNDYAILAKFPWARIYTTNIDDAFETAIQKSAIDSPQQVRIHTRKSPLVDRDQTFLLVDLIKLHGSVDRLEDGVIFSPTEFALEAASPSPWYSQIGYDYHNYTFIIIGSSLNEPILYQQVQHAHQKIRKTSPKTFLVIPSISELQKTAFTESNITHIPWTLTEFSHWLEDRFPNGLNYIDVAANNNPSISKLLSGKQKDIARRAESLSEIVHIRQADMRSANSESGRIRNFYRGFKPTWTDIADDIPAYTDDISKLNKSIRQALTSEIQCVIVYGPAGSGKSTATRMATFDIAKTSDTACFFTPGTNEKILDALIELEQIHKDRYIFICDRFEPCIEFIADALRRRRFPKALILAVESQHAWSDRVKTKLSDVPIHEFRIAHISQHDATLILEKLEEFGPWTRLAKLASRKREDLLLQKSKRQLLIGLLEATSGIGFEELIQRDYQSLKSNDHRMLLVVVGLASMHRLHLPISYAARALEKLGIQTNPADLLTAMDGVVSDTHGRLSARHPVYVRSLIESYISTNELGNMIKQLLHVFTVYDVPVIKSISKNESLLYKKIINNRFLRNMLRNREDKIIDIYQSLEKYFERDGLYWAQYGLALRHFGHQEDALEKLRTAVAAHEQAHTLHAYAHQQLIIALKEADISRAELLAEEAKAILEKLQYDQDNLGYRDLYPINILARGYTDFVRKTQGDIHARIVARNYADQIHVILRKRTDEHLKKTWAWLASYATNGIWRPLNLLDIDIEESL